MRKPWFVKEVNKTFDIQENRHFQNSKVVTISLTENDNLYIYKSIIFLIFFYHIDIKYFILKILNFHKFRLLLNLTKFS